MNPVKTCDNQWVNENDGYNNHLGIIKLVT